MSHISPPAHAVQVGDCLEGHVPPPGPPTSEPSNDGVRGRSSARLTSRQPTSFPSVALPPQKVPLLPHRPILSAFHFICNLNGQPHFLSTPRCAKKLIDEEVTTPIHLLAFINGSGQEHSRRVSGWHPFSSDKIVFVISNTESRGELALGCHL